MTDFKKPGVLTNTVTPNKPVQTPTKPKVTQPAALAHNKKISGSNVGYLKKVLRELGDVTIYVVDYNGYEIEAALAGNQYVVMGEAVTLAKSDIGYSITSTPTAIVGKVTDVFLDNDDKFNGCISVDIYPNGGVKYSGTSIQNYSYQDATAHDNVKAYSLLPGLEKGKTIKKDLWVDVYKRGGVFYFKSYFSQSSATFPIMITGGSGTSYQATLFENGVAGEEGATTETIDVEQLDLASGETIPVGTWAMASKASDGKWYMQVPIWL
jgi:hypothetical protein